MKIDIRKASAGDAQEVCDLFREAILAVDRAIYSETQLKNFALAFANKERWERQVMQDLYLVATDNATNEIVGCVSLQKTGRIDGLTIKPGLQNNGIASRLLEAINSIAEEINVLQLTVKSNLNTTSFFEKKGFQVLNISAEEIAGICLTNIILGKRLWLS